jgi:acyl carrier protein
MMTLEQVRQAITPMIVDVLLVEPEEVVPQARFFQDLGGESIDALELAFKCHKELGVNPEFQKLSAADYALDEQGRLTEASIARLKAAYPFLDLSTFVADPMANRITELFTVDAIVHMVYRALADVRPSHRSVPHAGTV